jgi:hypothetical protein
MNGLFMDDHFVIWRVFGGGVGRPLFHNTPMERTTDDCRCFLLLLDRYLLFG